MATKPLKTVSCDVCRLRKTKCDRPRYRNEAPPVSPIQPCSSCVEQKIPCTFNYVPQKPGPQPGRKRKSDVDTNGQNGVIRLSPQSSATTPRTLDIQSLVDPFNAESSGSTAPPVTPLFHSSPILPLMTPHLPSPRQPSGLGNEPPPRIDNPLYTLIPRATLTHIIDIYFGYIFCLTPFPHPPTFLSDLYNRREERPGEEEWTHMVLIMVASTLVQVPHQMLPHTVVEIREMVIRCLEATKRYLCKSYDIATINRNFIIYCAGLVEHNLGHDLSSREMHGSNVSVVLQRELDREITYSSLSPFDREMQSRVWWLIYCGDRSAACCEGAKLLIDEEGSSSVQLPNDDPRALEDPLLPFTDQSSILTGFRYISQAWRIAGQLLSRRNRDARKAPIGQEILVRLAEVEELLEQLEGLMEGCPSYLQLELASEDSLSPLEKLLNLGDDTPGAIPKADAWSGMSIPQPKRQYIIQQANIYITQQCVRMMGLQYREQLQSLRYAERERGGQLVASSSSKRQREIAIYREEQFAVLSYLLRILHSLPHELIAVNSLPGVTKIRYVAASLLAELEANPVNEDHNDVAHQRAVDYLSQYLTILAKIENLFSLAA